MSRKAPRSVNVERLLAQDAELTTFPFEESRVQLQLAIERLQRRAQSVNRAALCGLGVFITGVLATVPMQALGLLEPQWARLLWGACGLTAMIATGILTAIYSYRYQPALRRAQDSLLATTIAQLQQQVADLRRTADEK